MPRPPKRHHTVSRFYLSHFADEADQVTTVETPSGRTYLQSINNASVHSDYYTIVDSNGDPSDTAEQWFGALEGIAAEAWRAVAKGKWPLPQDQREAMAGWIALQLVRGPSIRALMHEVFANGVTQAVVLGGRELVRSALARAGKPTGDETVNQAWIEIFAKPNGFDVSSDEHVDMIGQLLPDAMDHLLGRIWYLTVHTDEALATCDHPVYVVPNPALAEVGLGTGIYTANQMHLPLTRRHSLSMMLPASLPPQLAALGDLSDTGDADTALYTNSCMTSSARRVLFHHPDDTPLDGFELRPVRQHETKPAADPWSGMQPEDRQVLLDAGLTPPSPLPVPQSEHLLGDQDV